CSDLQRRRRPSWPPFPSAFAFWAGPSSVSLASASPHRVPPPQQQRQRLGEQGSIVGQRKSSLATRVSRDRKRPRANTDHDWISLCLDYPCGTRLRAALHLGAGHSR
ncbi:unnamed protein product, partial [Ixodes hexagonus]